jgi:ribosome recycling factor
MDMRINVLKAVWEVRAAKEEEISDEDRSELRKKFEASRKLFSDINIRSLGFNYSNVAYVKCDGSIEFDNLEKLAKNDDVVSLVVDVPEDISISINDIDTICDMVSKDGDYIVIETDDLKLEYKTRTGKIISVEGGADRVASFLKHYVDMHEKWKKGKEDDNVLDDDCDDEEDLCHKLKKEYIRKLEGRKYELKMEISDIRRALDKIERSIDAEQCVDDLPDCVLDEVEEILGY